MMELNPFALPQLNSLPKADTAFWVLRLRWAAVIGQLLTVCVVAFVFRFEIRLTPLFALIALTATTNACFWIWLSWVQARPHPSSHNGTILGVVIVAQVLDVACLTGLLFWSGGVFNPFSLFFFANLAMAGLVLPPRWAWFITFLCILGNSYLLLSYQPLTALGTEFMSETQQNPTLILGHWLAFTTSSGVVTYFVTMLMSELRWSERRLAEVEKQKAKAQRLESLVTLAAGAGHELATPLSTIAVIVRELSRSLDKSEVPRTLRSDIEIIHGELDRCRLILNRMKIGAGEAAAEELDPISLEELIVEIGLGLRDSKKLHVECSESARQEIGILPVQAVALALRNLVQNAIDATEGVDRVDLQIEAIDGQWIFRIVDRGHGMDATVLQHVGEPFFTTKEPGRGMGLGVFLSQNVIQRLDGSVVFDSQPGIGTTCLVAIPIQTSPSTKPVKQRG